MPSASVRPIDEPDTDGVTDIISPESAKPVAPATSAASAVAVNETDATQTPDKGRARVTHKQDQLHAADDDHTHQVYLSERSLKTRTSQGHHLTAPAAHGHGHGHGESSLAGSVAAGAALFILYTFFSIVFSAVIFSDLVSVTSFGVAEGVGIILLGIGVGCLAFARGSGCKAIVSGPDLIPIITVQECGAAIQQYLQDEGGDMEEVIPTTLVAMIIGNLLIGATFYSLGRAKKVSAFIGFVPASVISGFLSCIGYKVIKLAVLISTTYSLKFKYMDKILATYDDKVDPYIPIVMALFIGVPLYVLKRMHIVRTDVLILAFIVVPLVLFYAGVAIEGSSMQELREAGWFLTTPYGCSSGSGSGSGSDGSSSSGGSDGSSSSSSSSDGSSSGSSRMLAESAGPYCAFGRVDFYAPLETAYGSGSLVAWAALPRCIGIWLMGACITALDSMLKLSSSENALKIDLDYNHEMQVLLPFTPPFLCFCPSPPGADAPPLVRSVRAMQVGGLATMLSALLAGAPSYGQTKFNVINYSIVHSTKTSVPTITCGVLAILMILSGAMGWIINGLPRFLLAGLLVYSGAGFLVEKLFEERKNTTTPSFCITWTIFIVNFLWEFFVKSELPATISPLVPGLLVVFLLGIVLAAFEFIASFMTKAPPGEPVPGREVCSTALRPQAIELRLGAMSDWFAVLPLHGFVFFGSATTFFQRLKALLEVEHERPRAERLRIVLVDASGLTGVDPTAVMILAKARRLLLDENHIELLWAGLGGSQDLFQKMGLLQGTRIFHTADLALKWVEDELLRRGRRLAQNVIHSSPTLERIHYRSTLSSVFSISTSSPDRISSARLLRYATRLELKPSAEIFDQSVAPEPSLYLLLLGEVQVIETFNRESLPRTLFPGAFFNQQRCVLRHASAGANDTSDGKFIGGGAPSSAVALTDAVLLQFTPDSFARLERAEPALALQLLRAVIRQTELQRPGRVRPLPTKSSTIISFSAGSCQLLEGEGEHRVELTKFQRARFGEIFDLIDVDSSGMISVHELEAYIQSVGRDIPAVQLAKLFHHMGWDTDGDGTLSRDEFYELARVTLMADLPKTYVASVEARYAEHAARSTPPGVVRRRDIPALLKSLGVVMPSGVSTDELIDVMDSDGSGDVSVDEVLTGSGMLRREQLEMDELRHVFSDMVATADWGYHRCTGGAADSGDTGDSGGSGGSGAGDQLSAVTLSHCLGIGIAEAEDLVFLADIDRFLEPKDLALAQQEPQQLPPQQPSKPTDPAGGMPSEGDDVKAVTPLAAKQAAMGASKGGGASPSSFTKKTAMVTAKVAKATATTVGDVAKSVNEVMRHSHGSEGGEEFAATIDLAEFLRLVVDFSMFS